MNLYHVQDCETWLKAPKQARAEFLERIAEIENATNIGHGAAATKDAWDWYILGWRDGYREER